jgi:hypothetical protein
MHFFTSSLHLCTVRHLFPTRPYRWPYILCVLLYKVWWWADTTHCALYHQSVCAVFHDPNSLHIAYWNLVIANTLSWLQCMWEGTDGRTVYVRLNIRRCTKHSRTVQRTCFILSYCNCYWLKFIALLGVTVLKWPLYLAFVKEKHRPETILVLMCTELLSDRGQSKWPKHVVTAFVLCFDQQKMLDISMLSLSRWGWVFVPKRP